MKLSVRANELETLLDRLPEGVTTLSFDCFDTLVWRDVHAPRDLFVELEGAGGFHARARAEDEGRRIARRHGRSETSLERIYAALYPNAGGVERETMMAAELEAEARACFAFAPAVALLRAAKARELKVIVVSDMYLSRAQLGTLLERVLGKEDAALIDRIFVSSEHGRGKREDLFLHVMTEIGVGPQQILHIGDNRAADVDRPYALGLNVAHFVQFDAHSEQRLRLEAATASMLDPSIRSSRAFRQPHRAQVAQRTEQDTAYVLGHDVLGPPLRAFAHWLKGELDELAERHGRPVRPLFIMRDGHLPMQVFQALYPNCGARAVDLSRVVASRATVATEQGLEERLDHWLTTGRIDSLVANLMLTKTEAAPLIAGRSEEAARKAIGAALTHPELRAKVLARGRNAAAKVAAHLRRAGVRDGDAIMLVDTGFEGSVQNMLTPVLTETMHLDIAGRYLFLRETVFPGFDKRGMIDRRNCDAGLVQTFHACVNVLEQLCTVAQGSTIDFTLDGKPIREDGDGKSAASALRDRIQAACLDFVRDSERLDHGLAALADPRAQRDTVISTLGRLLLMPLDPEVELFANFELDLNQGSKAKLRLVDPEAARASLRRRGLSYLNKLERVFTQADIHQAGFAHHVLLAATLRFGFDLRERDIAAGGIEVPVILIDGERQAVSRFPATPTADGYYRLLVPMGTGQLTAAVQLGQLCEWMQIESAELIPVREIGGDETATPVSVAADGLHAETDDMFRADPHGVLVAMPSAPVREAMALAVVFRPLKWRGTAEAQRAAA